MAQHKVSIPSNSFRLKLERVSAYEEHAKITGKMLLPHEGFPRENNGDWIILEENGERFGTVTFKGHAKRGETWNAPDPEGQSRAQLLVYAMNGNQELLDACKGLLRIIEDLAVGGNKPGWKNAAVATLEAAKATITRAESGA